MPLGGYIEYTTLNTKQSDSTKLSWFNLLHSTY